MNETSLPVKPESNLVINYADGNLTLRGWTREEIRIEGETTPDSKPKGNQIALELRGDCTLDLPHNLPISLEEIEGDVWAKDLGQTLQIGNIRGDVTLENISGATIQQANGNCSANQLLGDLVINSLKGNGVINQVIGQIAVQAKGDLEVHKIGRGIKIAAEGNITAAFDPIPWDDYQLQAGGNLKVSLPAHASITAELNSRAENIILQYAGIEEEIHTSRHTLEVGKDGAFLDLSAGGSIHITNLSWKYRAVFDSSFYTFQNLDQLIRDFSNQTSQQLGKHLSSLEKDLQSTLSGLAESLETAGLTEENLEKLKEKIQATGQQAANQAKITAQKAEQKIQHNITQIRQKARQVQERNRDFNLERFIFGARKTHDPADQEQLLILKMLEEQKITAAEAADLLSALE